MSCQLRLFPPEPSAWHYFSDSGDWWRRWPAPDGTYAAMVTENPYHNPRRMWRVWEMGDNKQISTEAVAYGPETGLEGRQKADAVLARLCR